MLFTRITISVLLTLSLVAMAGCEKEGLRSTTGPEASEETTGVIEEGTSAEGDIEGEEEDAAEESTLKIVETDSPCDGIKDVTLSVENQTCQVNNECQINIAASGGSGSYDYSSTSELPQGLSIDKGVIKGTPTVVGTSAIKVKATDAECLLKFAEATFQIAVTVPSLIYTGPSESPKQVKPPEIPSAPETPEWTHEAELNLEIKTGNIKHAGTGDRIFARICDNFGDLTMSRFDPRAMKHCMTRNISDLSGGFPRHITKIVKLGQCKLDDGSKCNYKDMNYYALRHELGNCDKWFVQSVKFILEERERSEVVYYNPCFLRWIFSADCYEPPEYRHYNKFSRNDTVACAVLKTGDVEHAGTDDKVWFEFSDDSKRQFNVPKHNDLKRGMIDADDWIWRGNQFNEKWKRKFYIRKEEDGKKGGWFLDKVWLYVFRPGKSFAADPKNPTSFYGAYRDAGVWLKNDELTYPNTGSVMSKEWIQLEEMELPEGFEMIGGHCH
jgi:hypothetical protein